MFSSLTSQGTLNLEGIELPDADAAQACERGKRLFFKGEELTLAMSEPLPPLST